MPRSGSGNVVRGARLWNNVDDGFDENHDTYDMVGLDRPIAGLSWLEALLAHGGLGEAHSEALLAIEESLLRLERHDPLHARVVDCRFYGGLTIEDTAEALGISAATVKRRWALAQAWLVFLGMVSTGETSGNLDQMLTKAAEFYDEESRHADPSRT